MNGSGARGAGSGELAAGRAGLPCTPARSPARVADSRGAITWRSAQVDSPVDDALGRVMWVHRSLVASSADVFATHQGGDEGDGHCEVTACW